MSEELKAYSSIVDRLKEIKLLPCPNCGETHNIGQNSDRKWHIYCFSCGMRGPVSEDEFHAADAWNTLPRRSDIERVEQERDWLLYFLEVQRICCYTEKAKEYCWSHDDFCDECPYMGREAWLKAIKEAVCPKN